MSVVCDGYTKIEVLGQGSFGKVYKVKENKTGKKYALKTFTDVTLDGDLPDSMLKELDILSRVRHPNVVSAHQLYISSNGSVCCVLPLANSDLGEALENGQVVDPLKTFYELCCGLNTLHANHIIHRDLKPQNCLWKDGQAMISDLDCIITPTDSFPPKLVTTLWYRAPEALTLAEPLTTKIDIWALGCIFYELFERKPLFPAELMDEDDDGVDALIALHEGLLDDEYLFGNIPEQYIPLLLRMLEIDPRKRPTVTEILQHEIFNPYRCTAATPHIFQEPIVESKLPVEISMDSRKILVSWMFEVPRVDKAIKLSLPPHVLFSAVDLLDRYLFKSPNVKLSELQMIGITCIMIMSKVLTLSALDPALCVYVTADSCTVDQIVATEKDICKKLGFRLYHETLYSQFPEKANELQLYLINNTTPHSLSIVREDDSGGFIEVVPLDAETKEPLNNSDVLEEEVKVEDAQADSELSASQKQLIDGLVQIKPNNTDLIKIVLQMYLVAHNVIPAVQEFYPACSSQEWKRSSNIIKLIASVYELAYDIKEKPLGSRELFFTTKDRMKTVQEKKNYKDALGLFCPESGSGPDLVTLYVEVDSHHFSDSVQICVQSCDLNIVKIEEFEDYYKKLLSRMSQVFPPEFKLSIVKE